MIRVPRARAAQAATADADLDLVDRFSLRRMILVITVPVLLIAGAVFASATIERDRALQAARRQAAGQRLLTAMLDEETGARGYFQTRQTRFLAPYYTGQIAFRGALADSRRLSAGDPALKQSLDEQADQNGVWLSATGGQIAELRASGRRPSAADALAGKVLVDGFRRLNSVYASLLTSRRDAALTTATWLAVGISAALCVLLVLTAIVLVRRGVLRERRRERDQHELRELLQVSASEKESQTLLIRYMQRSVPGSGAAVLNRNHSDDRLEVAVDEHADATPLRDLVTEQLRPRSCLAVRLSRTHELAPEDEPLMRCEACGEIAGGVLCEPLLVGGQVIGSVLVTRDGGFDPNERECVRQSVIQAAPILANQRNLALADRRAASDALTGLPNRRAADEAIKRMLAHAGRTLTPLSAVLLDLDHFKHINDVHGHDRGDKVLAAIGQLVAANLRASDFAARYGGEEFLLLLPDTDRGGALEVAEKLRRTIERAEIREVGTITASFGVAALPEDAVEPEQLLRKADRALYAAKARGRNRVELAVSATGLGRPSEPPREA